MRVVLALVCYVSAALCFVRFFWLTTQLAAERTVAPTPRELWTGWIPGEFTAAGARMRRRMTVLFILGIALMVVGFVL